MSRGAWFAVAVLAALGAASCQTLSGSGASGADFARYRTELAESRGRMDRAAQEGDIPGASKAMGEIRHHFDVIEARTSSMNLMDAETMKIQIATGRRTMTEADRWVQVSDAEAVRSQTALLGPVLDQIDLLLDRAARSSASETGTP